MSIPVSCCQHCSSTVNETDSNWCIECGKSIRYKDHKETAGPRLSNCNDILRSKEDSLDFKLLNSGNRKWSSSYYMWQKPSTLKISSQLITQKVEDIDSDDDDEFTLDKLSLLCLPNELLLFILSFLSFKDITACRLVCRRIYQLTFDSALRGKEITLNNTLTSIQLKQAALLKPSKLILKQCHCTLSSIDIETSVMLLGKNLKGLTIDTCNMGPFSNDILLNAVSRYCMDLITVNIHWIQVNGKYIVELVKKCRKLEVLSLQNVSGISLKHWKKIISNLSQNCPHLHTFHVKLFPEVPLPVLFSSTQSLTSLKTVSLSQNISKVQFSDIHLLLQAVPFLRTLNIECVEICKEALEYLKQRKINVNLQGVIAKEKMSV